MIDNIDIINKHKAEKNAAKLSYKKLADKLEYIKNDIKNDIENILQLKVYDMFANEDAINPIIVKVDIKENIWQDKLHYIPYIYISYFDNFKNIDIGIKDKLFDIVLKSKHNFEFIQELEETGNCYKEIGFFIFKRIVKTTERYKFNTMQFEIIFHY